MEYAQSLFEAITDSAVLLDKSGRVLDWNRSAATLFGYSKKDALGKPINFIFSCNYPFSKIIKESLPQQKKWLMETPFVRKNNTKGVCRSILTALVNPAQAKVAALMIHQNLSTYYKTATNNLKTDTNASADNLKQTLTALFTLYPLSIKNFAAREQLEKDLRESELRFRLLAENATDIIAQVSPGGSYLYVSPSCKTLLGYGPEEMIGQSAFKFLHHDDIAKLKKAFNIKQQENKNYTVVYRCRRKDGEFRWFEGCIRLICDEDTKRIREIQIASRDVTDHVIDKRVGIRKQQLAHVFRLSTMEEMASGMAHEISQPLAAIINYTRGCVRYLQSDKQNDPTQLVEVMGKAVAQAERAGEVIQRLKNFFCKGQLLKTRCKINSILRETVSLIRHDLTSSKTKVDLDFEKDLPFISADRIQLQQVMLNLLQNAIDAMRDIKPADRKIKIETKTLDKQTIAITVNDSGPGFSKELAHKVFKPFFSTKANGRGMGLAICRSIIEAHGGEFTINPNATNHSWIRFTLPME